MLKIALGAGWYINLAVTNVMQTMQTHVVTDYEVKPNPTKLLVIWCCEIVNLKPIQKRTNKILKNLGFSHFQ